MIILLMIAASVLALEIAWESTLAQDIKSTLRLDSIPPTIKALKKLSFWNKLFSIWLLPINLVLSLLFSIYSKIIELLNCAFCLSFWLSSISVYIYTDNLLESILLGLITIPITHLIQKIYD